MIKLNSVFGVFVVIAGLSACGISPEQDVSQVETVKGESSQGQADVGYRCEKVIELGSNIPKKRCTTAAQREKDQRDGEEYLRRNRNALKMN